MPLARFCGVQFSWPFMLVAIGGLLVLSALVVLGVRVLGRREAAEEARDLAVELARREVESLRPGLA
jgi:hypothetical protein